MERTTREEWAKRVQRWTESGMTAKEFGAEVGVHPGTLSYWKWRLGTERRPSASKPARGRKKEGRRAPQARPRAQPLSFVELAPPARVSSDGGFAFEVALQAGAVVRMRSEFDEEALARLLGVLGRRG